MAARGKLGEVTCSLINDLEWVMGFVCLLVEFFEVLSFVDVILTMLFGSD